MQRDAILIFQGIHRVMKAEKALKVAGLDVRLMPVPRQLSSDCGLSIACRLRDREVIEQTLDEAGAPYDELHVRHGESYRRLV
jgi:hypothetical protein